MVWFYIGGFFGILFIICGIVNLLQETYIALFLLAIGVILVAQVIYHYIYKPYKSRREKDEFFNYLSANRFTVSKNIGILLLDNITKRWCIYLNRVIFDISIIDEITILKKPSRTTTSSRSSFGNYSRYSTGSTTRTSRDTTTYQVMIKTTDINYPVITIPCGYSYPDAELIRTTIELIRKGA